MAKHGVNAETTTRITLTAPFTIERLDDFLRAVKATFPKNLSVKAEINWPADADAEITLAAEQTKPHEIITEAAE